MALHTVGMRDLWDDWAQQSEKFDDQGQSKAWDHFSPRADGVTIASIFKLAQDYGWDPNAMQRLRSYRTKTQNDVGYQVHGRHGLLKNSVAR